MTNPLRYIVNTVRDWLNPPLIMPPSEPEMTDFERSWSLKQQAALPGYYYGDGGTIHDSVVLDVETYRGEVVAVWFRCKMLPFEQVKVEKERAVEMKDHMKSGVTDLLTGVELLPQSELDKP